MKPLIGINATWIADGASPAMVSTRSNYVAAVLGAGGVPMVLPMVEAGEQLGEIVRAQVEACDGFVFIGGPDIDPSRWGEEPHPTVALCPAIREQYDFALIAEVVRQQKPFLGICMGCQEVNVVQGGALIQDIAAQLPESNVPHSLKQAPYLHRHNVVVEPGTVLAGLLTDDGGVGGGNTKIFVSTNSAHHQAVRELGQGVRVSARCIEDGVIEAIELENYPFGLGIQWHPEYLQGEREHRRLFEGLVEAARGSRVVA